MGSKRGAGAHRKLKRLERFTTEVAPGGEQFLFVWRGAIQVKHENQTYAAGEKDTAFISGPAKLEVRGESEETVVIQVEAPPSSGRQ